MPDREYFNDRRKNRRAKFIELLGGKCERCGSTKNLHFDHKQPNKKEFRIADRIDAPEDLLLAEVNKCRLLCDRCHREKTRENAEHGQPKLRHGTLHMYKRYGCRCDKCKQRMSEYNSERRMMNTADINDLVNNFLKIATPSLLDDAEHLMSAISIQTRMNTNHDMISKSITQIRRALLKKDYHHAFDWIKVLGKHSPKEVHDTIITLARKVAEIRREAPSE